MWDERLFEFLIVLGFGNSDGMRRCGVEDEYRRETTSETPFGILKERLN